MPLLLHNHRNSGPHRLFSAWLLILTLFAPGASVLAQPTASVPAGFDVPGYFARNSDIATTYANNPLGAWQHFWNYGLDEGRTFDSQFVVDEYLELNLDLKIAFGTDRRAALLHWLNYGKPLEDRKGRVPIGFNVESYLARYPDLAAVFGNISPTARRHVSVWNHYLDYGVAEGRSDGDFDAYNYLATNADLAAGFGSDVQAAALHWYFYGRREGRRIPAHFNVQGYRALNPDVVVVWGNDLYGCWLHYRDTGIGEGRYFDELFRVLEYRDRYPDLQAAYGNNLTGLLLHWLYYGKAEGRVGRTSLSQSHPILYVTQVPVSGFVTRASAFGNHSSSMESCPRGGDLMIRYPDGTTRNLTQEAGYGMTGFQGANAIAVREPSVHWSGSKAVFSMLLGATPNRYAYLDYFWQLYEVTGLGQGQTVQITKVPNQPTSFNNISPTYGSDGRLIFTSDRPRNGQRHLYPQLDEYESAATVTGVWSLNPANSDLRLLTHTPSGAFNPMVDSSGRVLYTRWDHLQQDQQADADRETPGSYGAFTYADESASAVKLALGREVFPEPRDGNDPENVSRHRSGNGFNLFMPWQVNQDGTEEETLNHVGRHEITNTYRLPIFLNDPNLSDQVNRSLFANKTFLRGADGGMFFLREDPQNPGTYFGIHAPEFFTDGAGQIVKLTGSPSLNAEQMVMTALTDPVTAMGRDDNTPVTAGHVGLFRSPLPLTDGRLVAVHNPDSRFQNNDGTRANPDFRYEFRLRFMTKNGTYYTPGAYVTTGTAKTVTWYDPDVLVTHTGPLWELDPVEVVARTVPPVPTGQLQTPEQQVLTEEGVNEAALRQWLAQNNLALIVTRNNTIRDRGDLSQPFNLRVPGGISTTPKSGKIYDISHLQIVQGDQVRGYGGMADPRLGRRVLAQFLHDPAAQNPANPTGPVGSVKLGTDGSSAAFVPARRAMSWQLTDNAGEPVVVERNWVTFQPGEIRTCAGCHGANTKAHGNLDSPTNKPEALRDLLRYWKTL